MKSFLNRYATPLTTGLFAVSVISGIALFFHWHPSAFHGMHEWLSMVLLLPFAVHLWKNWPALKAYIRRRTMILPVALSLLLALPFAAPALTGSAGTGGNPAFRAAALLTDVPLTDLAPVFKTTPEALRDRLTAKGHTVPSTEVTLASLAKTSGSQPNSVLFSLLDPD